MVGKLFMFENEEWEVEEVLLYSHRCVCRSYYSDKTRQFYCDFVKGKIASYENDLEEERKKLEAITFAEEEEKALLKKIITHYRENVKLSEISGEEFVTLLKMVSKIY